MDDSFFTSEMFRFGSTFIGILLSSGLIIWRLKERTMGTVFEVITMVTLGITGFVSMISFGLHFFYSDMIANSIGWPIGSPFQKEVAGANLAIGLIGFICFWRRDFWLPYIISKTAFLLVAGVTHVMDIIETSNVSPGNAGFTLYMDFIWPIIFILLIWFTNRLKIST